MTVLEFSQQNGYTIISCAETAVDREISGVYICDLLSMAMVGVKDGNLWITVHTNINIIAVASLTNASCIVIPEDIPVESQTVKKAEEKGIILVQSPHTSYEISVRYYVQSGGDPS
ncbi:MAG: hypothetical protein GX144_09180 [Clostridiaceae bacterium]|nr:hypothetical protein [Clostridiaceae bacterium]